MIQVAINMGIPHAHIGNDLLFRLRTGQTTLKDARVEVAHWRSEGREKLAAELDRWLFAPVAAAA